MIKIDVVAGFLGAGKTTLIKKILDERPAGQVIAVVENEFGDIGLDGELLRQDGVQVEEIYSGCICCTLLGSFERALLQLIEKFGPDRIIIEPTGIARLSDVERACLSAQKRPDVRRGMRVVVVNAANYDRYMKGWPEFFCDQIENARTVVFSRTGQADEKTLEYVSREIRRINPKARQITTPWEQLEAEAIIGAAERDAALSPAHELANGECACGCGRADLHSHPHTESHNADRVFDVWGTETPKVFSRDALAHALHSLDSGAYGIVLRAKGTVSLSGGRWTQFDFVPGETSMKDSPADCTGRLCVIGQELDKPALAVLFGLE